MYSIYVNKCIIKNDRDYDFCCSWGQPFYEVDKLLFFTFTEKAKNRELINNLNNKRNTTRLLPTSMTSSTSEIKKVNVWKMTSGVYWLNNKNNKFYWICCRTSPHQQKPRGHGERLWGRRGAPWRWALLDWLSRVRTTAEHQRLAWAWPAQLPAPASALKQMQRSETKPNYNQILYTNLIHLVLE